METWDSQIPLLRQLHLPPTWTDHAAGGDILQAYLFSDIGEMGKSRRLDGRSANAISLLGRHRLADLEQHEGDADASLPDKWYSRADAVLAVQPLTIHRHPNLNHPEHHDEDMNADLGRGSIHERGYLL